MQAALGGGSAEWGDASAKVTGTEAWHEPTPGAAGGGGQSSEGGSGGGGGGAAEEGSKPAASGGGGGGQSSGQAAGEEDEDDEPYKPAAEEVRFHRRPQPPWLALVPARR